MRQHTDRHRITTNICVPLSLWLCVCICRRRTRLARSLLPPIECVQSTIGQHMPHMTLANANDRTKNKFKSLPAPWYGGRGEGRVKLVAAPSYTMIHATYRKEDKKVQAAAEKTWNAIKSWCHKLATIRHQLASNDKQRVAQAMQCRLVGVVVVADGTNKCGELSIQTTTCVRSCCSNGNLNNNTNWHCQLWLCTK